MASDKNVARKSHFSSWFPSHSMSKFRCTNNLQNDEIGSVRWDAGILIVYKKRGLHIACPQFPAFIRVKFFILELNSCAPLNLSAYLPNGKKIGTAITHPLKALEGFWIRSAMDKREDYSFHLTALTKSVLMVKLHFIAGQGSAEKTEAATESRNNYRNICCELDNILWYFPRQYKNSFFYNDILNTQFK